MLASSVVSAAVPAPGSTRFSARRPFAALLAGALVGSLAALVPVAPAAAADPVLPSNVISVPCSGAGNRATAADLDAFRRAVEAVSADGTIRLAADCTYSFTAPHTEASGTAGWYGASALPAVYHPVTIDGRGAVIERAAPTGEAFRLFFVGADGGSARTSGFASPGPGRLVLRDVTLANGLARGGSGSAGGGGGAGMGGAIFNQGEVELDRVTVRGNVARGGNGHGLSPFRGGGGGGGGISGSANSGGGGAGVGFVGAGAAGGAGGAFVTSNSRPYPQAGSGGGGGGLRSVEKGDAGVAPGAGAAGGTSARQTGLGGRGGGVPGGAAGGTAGNGSGGGGAAADHPGALVDGGDGGAGGKIGQGGVLGDDGSVGAGPYSPGGGGGGGGVGGGGGGGGDGASVGASFFGDSGGQGGGGGGGGFAGGGGPGGFGGKGGDNFVGGGGPGNGGAGGHAGAGGFGGGGGGGGRGGDPGKGMSDGLNAAPPDGRRGGGGAGAPGGFGAGDGSAGFSDVSGGGGGGAGMGGAIFNQNGRVTLNSVTMTGNEARGGVGGGVGTSGGGKPGRGLGGAVFNLNGSVRSDSATMVSNRADEGGGIFNLGYLGADGASCSAGACDYEARTTLVNSIVTGSLDLGGFAMADVVSDRPATVATGATNLVPSVVDTGSAPNRNIVTRSASQGGASISGTPLTVDPGLAPTLASNVPSTPTPEFTPPATFAISRDSAAYNAGQTALATDARGVARPTLGAADIGAFEFTLTTPTMTVEATPARVDLGKKARAKVTMSGGPQTSGNIDFALHGPGDTDCTGTPVLTSTFKLTGGESLSEYSAAMTAMGSYRWKASYTGDGNNWPVTSACGAAVSEVGKATTSISSGAEPASAATVDPIGSQARVIGYQPTGSVTFALHGPGDIDCAAAPIFTSTVAISPYGSAWSETVRVAESGSYRWVLSYTGDANNTAATTVCGASGQTVQVGFRATLTTQAVPALVILGDRMTATATVVGGDSPTGDVTFTLYPPNDTTCSTPIFTSTRPLSASGATESAPYLSDELSGRPTLGTYRWRAAYSGDGRNPALAPQACGPAGQTVEMFRAWPGITAVATPTTAYSGGTISAVATLRGLARRPDTSVRFDLYAESDTSCSTSLFTRYGDLDEATTDSAGRFVVTSTPLTPNRDGNFYWVASYAGDPYNHPAATPCGERELEVTVGGQAPPVGDVEPTIAASAVPTRATLGTPLRARATLGGGARTGIVQFALVGPFGADTPCTEFGASSIRTTAIDGDLRSGELPGKVPGEGTWTSGALTPTEVGTYYWRMYFISTANGVTNTSEACGPDSKVVVTDAPAATAPVTPTIGNLPAAGEAKVGGGFTAVVTTDSDGVRTVTSSSPGVCTTDGLTVTYVAAGTCSLTPRVAASSAYLAGTGDPSELDVVRKTVPAPSVSNLPSSGAIGGGFTASVSTQSDGATSVTSGSPAVCTADGLVVSFVGVGSCELTARVAQSASYAPREGVAQSVAVGRRTATAPSVSNLPSGGVAGDGFTAAISTDSDGVRTVSSSTPTVCTTDGLKVSYVGAGSCELTARVAQSASYAQRDGAPQSVTVSRRTATVPSVSNLPSGGVAGDGFTAAISTDSDGVRTVSSSTPTVCTTVGLKVSYVGAGSCELTARVAESASYAQRDGAPQSVAVSRRTATVPSVSNLPAGGVAGGGFTAVVATDSDGVRTVSSSTPTVCTTDGLKVSFVAAGSCELTARVAQSASFASRDGVAQSTTVGRRAATLPAVSNLPTGGLPGGGFTAVVATDSDGVRTVSSSTPMVCTTDGLKVSFVAAGSCELTARVAQSPSYAQRDGVAQSVTVGRRTPTVPSIADLPGSGVAGGGFTAAVASDSDGVRTVSSSTPTVCTTDGLKVSFVAAGSCELTARVAQSATYAQRDGVAQSVVVARRAATVPSISNLPGSGVAGGGFTAVVATDSDGARTVSSSTPAVCTTDGLKVSFVGVGSCGLTARVAQSPSYTQRDGAAQSVAVARRPATAPSISNLPTGGVVGGGFTAVVATDSDGARTVTSSTPTVCKVDGFTVSYVAAGTCSLTARVAASDLQEPADGAAQTFAVDKRVQTLAFGAPANRKFGSAPFAPTVTSSSGLPVTITSLSTETCTVSGSTVTVVGGGTCSIRATQPGSPVFTAAAPVTRSFAVLFSSPCITSSKARDLTVRTGESVCIYGGTVNGGITVQAGGALWVKQGAVKGQVTSTGATAVSICASELNGVTVRSSAGLVKVGGLGCGNRLGNVTLTKNTRGVVYVNNVARIVSIIGTRGGLTYGGNKSASWVLTDNS